jgi:hypothetical protein
MNAFSKARLPAMLCAVLGIAVLAQPARANQDAEYIAVVQAQLSAVKDVYTSAGFKPYFDDHVDRLGSGAADSYTFQLSAGREYMIVSVCDQDCSDLDLTLTDENGNVVSEDDAVDDAPIVSVTPSWTGKFTLSVLMYACSQPPCYYGISVVEK